MSVPAPSPQDALPAAALLAGLQAASVQQLQAAAKWGQWDGRNPELERSLLWLRLLPAQVPVDCYPF
jgi:hypothetical protein